MRTHILGRDIFMEDIAHGGSSATLALDARGATLDVASATLLSGAQRCLRSATRVAGLTRRLSQELSTSHQIQRAFSQQIYLDTTSIRVQLAGLHLTRASLLGTRRPVLHPPTNRTR